MGQNLHTRAGMGRPDASRRKPAFLQGGPLTLADRVSLPSSGPKSPGVEQAVAMLLSTVQDHQQNLSGDKLSGSSNCWNVERGKQPVVVLAMLNCCAHTLAELRGLGFQG